MLLSIKMMNRATYYLIYSFLWIVALLPYRLLYVLSDILYLIIYHILGYRKKVVRQNLKNSFPSYDSVELNKIEKRFYKNLSDIVVETIKLLHVRPNQVRKRFHFTNPEVINELVGQNKSVFLAFGHSSNWEMMVHALSFEFDLPVIALYKKISSPVFDSLMKHIRMQWGKVGLFESQTAYRQLVGIKEKPHLIYILGDQTPPGLEADYWTQFLHQDTPFFNGLEKMAKSLGHAVVYFESTRTGRGKYSLTAISICENGKETAQDEIIEKYVRLLENTIRQQPDNWLWSHRRWKHQRKKPA